MPIPNAGSRAATREQGSNRDQRRVIYVLLTLIRTQCPAIMGNTGNRKPVACTEFANPCNSQQPRLRTRNEQVSGSSPLVGYLFFWCCWKLKGERWEKDVAERLMISVTSVHDSIYKRVLRSNSMPC